METCQRFLFVLCLLVIQCPNYSVQDDSDVTNGGGDTDTTSGNSGSQHAPHGVNSTRLDHVKVFSFFKDQYDQRIHGRLNVEVEDATTSSIDVKWSLPSMTFRDSVLESNVVCETSSGFLLSKKHVTSEATYRLEHLHANTSYIVCVYMLERSRSSNTTVLHFSCHASRTARHVHIPSMRTDSIVAVVVTFGYIAVMVAIGYVTWRWKKGKQMEDEAREKLAIEDDDFDDDDENDNNDEEGGGMLNGGGGGGVGNGAASGLLYDEDVEDGRQSGSSASRKGNNGSMAGGSSRLLNNAVGRSKSGDGRGGRGGRGDSSGRSASRSSDNIPYADSHSAAAADIVMEKEKENNSPRGRPSAGSADGINNGGCLDLKRNSASSPISCGQGSDVRLSELAEPGSRGSGSKKDRKYQKSQSLEDGLVKVTEITF